MLYAPDSSIIDDFFAVFKIIFVVNTGRLLMATTDNTISLWDFKTKTPHKVQTLQLSRENVTELCLEFQDKWLYIGTDKGNVHVLNMENFTLSGYKIDWNRLMDPLTKHLPGNTLLSRKVEKTSSSPQL